jgi:hypothetical protein
MNDFAFVAIILAFFAASALFVQACDRIIGGDEEAFAGPADPEVRPEEATGSVAA